MRTRQSRWRRRDAGASAVEFAFLLPLFLLVIAGLVDFGLYFNTQIQLSNAAREGARMAALGKPIGTSTSNGDDIWTRAKRSSPNIADRSDFAVSLDVSCATATNARVTVALSSYQWIILGPAMRLINGGSPPGAPVVASTAEMRCA